MELIPTIGLPGGSEIFVILFILGIPFLMMVIALIDILKSEFAQPNNKIVWVVVVILLPFIGSLIYFLIGRGQKTRN